VVEELFREDVKGSPVAISVQDLRDSDGFHRRARARSVETFGGGPVEAHILSMERVDDAIEERLQLLVGGHTVFLRF